MLSIYPLYEETRFSINYQLIFNKVVQKIKDRLNFDLSYMSFKITDRPVFNNGKINHEMDPKEFGGSWTKKRIIYLNNDPESVMRHYRKRNNFNQKEVIEFVEMIIAHELSHEIYSNLASDEFKKKIITAAKNEKFTTEYLVTVPERKYDEEIFCEYLANKILK